MNDIVECPYCESENDMTDALIESPSGSNKFDWECENCEKEFEVLVEFDPVFTTSKIEYAECDECGKTTRDIYEDGKVAPFPSCIEGKKVCQGCFSKAYRKELDKVKE